MGMDSHTKLSLIFKLSSVLRSFKAITSTFRFLAQFFPNLSSPDPLIYILWRLKKICAQIRL